MVMSLMSNPKASVATVIVSTTGDGDYNCDGTADEVEIQAAIDSLPAGGGVVSMREGTYNIDASIAIDDDNVALIGTGFGTIIFLSANSDTDVIVIGDAIGTPHEGIIIQNLQIDGNRANQTGGVNDALILVYLNATRIFIAHCYIHDGFEHGIYLLNASNETIISNSFIISNGDSGIGTSLCRGVIISNNYVSDNLGTGMFISDCRNILMEGNHVGNNNRGIDIAGIGLPRDNSVIGNTIINNTGDGVWVSAANNRASIVSNNIRDNGDEDIDDDGTNTQIAHNITT